jgi:hypothetical protein
VAKACPTSAWGKHKLRELEEKNKAGQKWSWSWCSMALQDAMLKPDEGLAWQVHLGFRV